MSSPKVWFVTGCSSGLGEAFVNEILSRGDKCIATARNTDKLATLKAAGADVLQFDVTAAQDTLNAQAQQAVSIHGRIDFLINNAGYFGSGTLEESSASDLEDQFGTNVFGAIVNTTRAFLPTLRKQRSGVIANISSIGAWGGWAGAAGYCGSKWAVTGISECLSQELADFGIKVCAVEPGYFRSRLLNTESQKDQLSKETRLIADYHDTAADQVAQGFKLANGHQPGDLKKGAKVVVDVLLGKGGKDVPLRLALGTDAYGFIKKKCEDTLALLEEYKDVTCSTDHDDVAKP